jgi:hypothetical protein
MSPDATPDAALSTLDYPIMAVLEDAADAILAATGGALAIPAGGYLASQALTRKGCIRLTIDVVVHPPERRIEPEAWGARRLLAFERNTAAAGGDRG